MNKMRVTVSLHATSLLEPGMGPASVASEFAHEEDVTETSLGVQIRDGGARSFFPWTSILRVDREACDCKDCLAS